MSYPLSGILYHEGVRYWAFMSDDIHGGGVYMLAPITAKEFKHVMRGLVNCRSVLDKHPFYRIYTQDVLNEEYEVTVTYAERLASGLRDIGELNKPTEDAYMANFPKLSHPDFYK